MKRCLMFLPLEMQVSDWVTGCESLPEDAKAQLRRNANDELKHDTVLTYLCEYYGLLEESQANERANQLMQRWQSLECHPILSAYALEMGVFFTILPTLIKHGDVYAATVAQWINDDERTHVECNLRIVRELGLKLTEELVRLVFDTCFFINESLGLSEASKAAKRAVKRLTSTKDAAMVEDSLPTTIAFFEQQAKSAIVY